MNLKTTLVLLILVIAGGVFLWLDPALSRWLPESIRPAGPASAVVSSVIPADITSENLTRVELHRGERKVVFERNPQGAWTLPGNWPARAAEVNELIARIMGLQSRFAPLPLGEGGKAKFGLEGSPIVVKLQGGKAEHTLTLGEPRERGDKPAADIEPNTTNRFSQPTYLLIDESNEVIRLAPGLLAALGRPQEYYQQRRLFEARRVPKDADSAEKTEELAANSFAVKGTSAFTVAQKNGEWELTEPVRDRVDPDKLKSFLAAIPDIWAEQFVDKPKSDLAEYGLKEPAQTLRITRPNGKTIVLLIGKQSQMKKRKVMMPAPNLPGQPPMPPQPQDILEEYRFAKLQDNEQIFEIKADKLKDVFVAVDAVRDARLARFKTEDARRLEITQAGNQIVLAKDKDQWRLQKPIAADAESSKITELLDKLSNLQSRDKDILDKADLKTYALDKPTATVKIQVEEEIKGEGTAKIKKNKEFTFQLGNRDAEAKKQYVRVEGWDRVNAVEDGLLKLIERPALAYRGRRVLDFFSTDLAKIEVKRPGESYTLEQTKGTWKLAVPVQAEIDGSKINQLADDLGRLEAVEFETESAKPETLEAQFGLGKPTHTAIVTPSDTKKPAQTLLVGKQRPGKTDYFAKLTSAPGVFVIKKETRDALDQDSLAFRPQQLWSLAAMNIREVKIQKSEPEYKLARDGDNWKIAGPFDAPVPAASVDKITQELASPRCEKFIAHVAKDLGAYGLDKPYLRVAVLEAEPAKPKEEKPGDKKEDKPKDTPKPAAKERILLIGKLSDKEGNGRFAKLADGEAVFVLANKIVNAVDHSALDLLNRDLLTLDSNAIERIRSTGAQGNIAIQKKSDAWQVVESPTTPFPADAEVVTGVLGAASTIRAQKFVAYGPKAQPAEFGLDKPSATIMIGLRAGQGDAKNAKPVEHTLLLGKPVNPGSKDCYARLDNGPGIFVLSSATVAELTHGYLDFVNHGVFRFDAAGVTGFQRQAGNDRLEIALRDKTWKIAKPADNPADNETLSSLVQQLGGLRSKRVAAYPASDLKPFGLDNPSATITLRWTASDGKKSGDYVLRLGKKADEASGDYFASAAAAFEPNAVAKVHVIAGSLARQLMAGPLQFRDRNLARVQDVDRISLERGPRKAAFAKADNTWKLVDPASADAEQTELEDFLNSISRLRADELVADKPADLKAFGLDKPEIRWRAYSGEKEIMHLLVGKREPGKTGDDGRSYAKLAGSDMVFLLSPTVTTKALAEYRSRSFWPSLDASQIERLSYTQGGTNFVLDKADNEWRLFGKPGIKVKAETVRDTLDALAGLKATKYVTDKGADTKLYGLEPPQVILEIQTSSGKRVLHIGRPEGESKRFYARVGDQNDGVVFVISEGDAGRILKGQAAFVQEAGKTAAAAPLADRVHQRPSACPPSPTK